MVAHVLAGIVCDPLYVRSVRGTDCSYHGEYAEPGKCRQETRDDQQRRFSESQRPLGGKAGLPAGFPPDPVAEAWDQNQSQGQHSCESADHLLLGAPLSATLTL